MFWARQKNAHFGQGLGFDMMVKVIIVFLLAMALVGMIGKVLFPGTLSRSLKKRLLPRSASGCPRCGRYLIGSKGCDCGPKQG